MSAADTVQQCVHKGAQVAEDLYRREEELVGTDAYRDGGVIPGQHNAGALEQCKTSYSLLMATKVLQREYAAKKGGCPFAFNKYLQQHKLQVDPEECIPRPAIQCDAQYKYRSIDGSCNNLKYPSRGQANTALERLLPANYADGVYSPSVSVSGQPLPSARLLSRTLFTSDEDSRYDSRWTQMCMAFGQYLSHDFALSPPTQTYSGFINCCSKDGSQVLPKNQFHHACFPIHISPGDPFYSQFNQNCMNFVRSMTISRDDCTLGTAEQANIVTSYLDASPVYGNDEEKVESMRSFHQGRLLSDIDNDQGHGVLPKTSESPFCRPPETCYSAGDVRANQNPPLAIIHTLLHKEHNRIADELHSLNPHWDDERLFQEARNILIAIIQEITYYEWLPIWINREYLEKHHIINTKQGLAFDYNVEVSGATLNDFTAGAFRYPHSTIYSHIPFVSENRKVFSFIRFRDYYNQPGVINEKEQNFDALLRGMATEPMMASDGHYTDDITNYLFRMKKSYGLDLESLDIQRGRDHGLASYIKYREMCGLPKVTSFDDLRGTTPQQTIRVLQELYRDVRDIDFFVGATAEKHAEGSLVGPTIQCIFGEQFYRWRVGDRFFFDSDSNPNPLTRQQLAEIKKASLARLVCDNGKDIKRMQPRIFEKPSRGNPLLSCQDNSIPRIDLRAWQET